jgi:hypothetical protein
MDIQVKLSPEVERVLRAKAAGMGKSLEDYISEIADREAGASNGMVSGPSQSGDWSAEWRAWGEAERNLSSGIQLGDSRESIYAGRGE